jgi:hypothetical protein
MGKKVIGNALRNLVVLSAVSGAVMLAGCASPATVQGMVSAQPPATPIKSKVLLKNISVNQVAGGEATDPLWMSEVGAIAFKQALVESLQDSSLYNELAASHYHLNANLVELKKPLMGIDLTDTCKVHYQLIDARTNKTVFDKVIVNQYTAEFSDALIEIKRQRLANEGVVRGNIHQLIEELYRLNIVAK